jgi:hypothetical protein
MLTGMERKNYLLIDNFGQVYKRYLSITANQANQFLETVKCLEKLVSEYAPYSFMVISEDEIQRSLDGGEKL